MSLDPSLLAVTELTTRLRAGAAGQYASEAAVELLIRHWSWLARPDFLRACVATSDLTTASALRVDWRAARAHAESIDVTESERAVVLIAAQIATLPHAEHGIPDNYPALGWLIPGLGRVGIDLVLAAISHVGGSVAPPLADPMAPVTPSVPDEPRVEMDRPTSTTTNAASPAAARTPADRPTPTQTATGAAATVSVFIRTSPEVNRMLDALVRDGGGTKRRAFDDLVTEAYRRRFESDTPR